MEDYESKKPKLARQIIAGKRKRKTERKIERSTVREIGEKRASEMMMSIKQQSHCVTPVEVVSCFYSIYSMK